MDFVIRSGYFMAGEFQGNRQVMHDATSDRDEVYLLFLLVHEKKFRLKVKENV